MKAVYFHPKEKEEALNPVCQQFKDVSCRERRGEPYTLINLNKHEAWRTITGPRSWFPQLPVAPRTYTCRQSFEQTWKTLTLAGLSEWLLCHVHKQDAHKAPWLWALLFQPLICSSHRRGLVCEGLITTAVVAALRPLTPWKHGKVGTLSCQGHGRPPTETVY